jgi:hypothetical protein
MEAYCFLCGEGNKSLYIYIYIYIYIIFYVAMNVRLLTTKVLKQAVVVYSKWVIPSSITVQASVCSGEI